MLRREHSKIVWLFQFYGVVTLKSATSVCWSFVSFFLGIATILKAFDIGVFSMTKLRSLSGMSHFYGYSLLLLARMTGSVSSIFHARKFQEILDEFKSFDAAMWQLFEIEVNSRARFVKLSIKMIFIAAADLAILMGNYTILRNEKPQGFWMLTSTTIHTIHLKDLSLIFFIDLLNYRLDSLKNVLKQSETRKVLKLHTKLFDISRLINDCHSGVIALNIFQHCSSFISNFFWLFLSLSKLEFFVGIYRK